MLAVASALDVDSGPLLKIATPFCGGMSRTSGLCGAVGGGVIVVGSVFGRDEHEDSVEPSYAATGTLIRQFESEFGSRDCTDLTGYDLSTPEGLAAFRSSDRKQRCSAFVRRAAELSASLVREQD